jgi:hypothetical protein
MKNHLVVCTVSLLLVAGCRREQPVAPAQTATSTAPATMTGEPQDMTNTQVTEVIVPSQREFVLNSRVGTAAGSDGMVSADLETFKRAQPVRLSMWLKESPSGLQTSAVVFDENDQKVTEERKSMNGAKTVTFTFNAKKWKPGMYRIVGYWGGNVAAEHVVKLTR